MRLVVVVVGGGSIPVIAREVIMGALFVWRGWHTEPKWRAWGINGGVFRSQRQSEEPLHRRRAVHFNGFLFFGGAQISR